MGQAVAWKSRTPLHTGWGPPNTKHCAKYRKGVAPPPALRLQPRAPDFHGFPPGNTTFWHVAERSDDDGGTCHYACATWIEIVAVEWEPVMQITWSHSQKRIIRVITVSKCKAHTEKIVKTLKLLKVNDILKLQELKLYYKYKNKKLTAIYTFQKEY